MSTRNAERMPGPHRNAGDSTEGATGATTIACGVETLRTFQALLEGCFHFEQSKKRSNKINTSSKSVTLQGL
jgi:hypothetical protein